MVAAIILPDNTIAGVLMADASKDTVPPGWPEGAKLVEAPEGCYEGWSYDPVEGFKAPPPPVIRKRGKTVVF
jgi:hypothetical protein